MGVFDFLFGEPGQSGQLDPQTQAARDFLMNQMLMQYSAGPVNVPRYQAVAPSGTYSGTNSLLASLGLETVEPPSMPTTNVGGMEVYTSEPIQTDIEASYAEKYPGQYDYLRSFYMDPATGQFGSRSYGYANPMMNALAASAGGGGSGGGGGAAPVGGGGYNTSTTSINTPLSYLPGGANDPFLTSAPSQAIASLSTPSGMSRNNDGSYSRSGSAAPTTSIRPVAKPAPKVDLPGNVVTRALNIGAGKKDSSSDSGYAGDKDDGTVMCTAYCEMGYLPKAIWALDRRYGVKMYREDPTLIEGYHMWGVPVANYLRKQTFGAKVLRAVMWPIVKAWAEEMAHNMKPDDYAPNYFGKLIKFVGEPFSRMCGKLKKVSLKFKSSEAKA